MSPHFFFGVSDQWLEGGFEYEYEYEHEHEHEYVLEHGHGHDARSGTIVVIGITGLLAPPLAKAFNELAEFRQNVCVPNGDY